MRLSKTELIVIAGFVLGGCLIVGMVLVGIYTLNSEDSSVAEAVTPQQEATPAPPPPTAAPTEALDTPTPLVVQIIASTPTATRVLPASGPLDREQSLESYSHEVLRLTDEYFDNISQLWKLQEDANRNLALVDDPAWQAETTALLENLRAANSQLSSIRVPPDASQFHDKLRVFFHSCMSGASHAGRVADGIDSYADLGSLFRAWEQNYECLLYSCAIDPDLELSQLAAELSPTCIDSINDYLAQVGPPLAAFREIMNEDYREEPPSPAAGTVNEQRLGQIQAQVEAVPTPECGAQSADNIRSIVQLGAATYVQAVTDPEDEFLFDPIVLSTASTLSEELLRRVASSG